MLLKSNWDYRKIEIDAAETSKLNIYRKLALLYQSTTNVSNHSNVKGFLQIWTLEGEQNAKMQKPKAIT